MSSVYVLYNLLQPPQLPDATPDMPQNVCYLSSL